MQEKNNYHYDCEEDFTKLKAWLFARTERKSKIYEGHSEHFEKFPPKEISIPNGFVSDYMGNLYPTHFGYPGNSTFNLPEINEEYFEFLDIFEAVIDSNDNFTIMEWGAGFGRWTAIAIKAAKSFNKNRLEICAVEAHPLHMAYLIETISKLELDVSHVKVLQIALGKEVGRDIFLIEQPEDQKAVAWWGQALNNSMMDGYVATADKFFGSTVHVNKSGWRGIEVDVGIGSEILKDYAFIDIVDLDIQGVENDVITECIEHLNNKVRRLHIGTHSREIEIELRKLLHSNGWILLRDLKSNGNTLTSYGNVHCVDGVQSWFNSRFPPAEFLNCFY